MQDELEFLREQGLVREETKQEEVVPQEAPAVEPAQIEQQAQQPVEKVESAPTPFDYSSILGEWASPEKAATIPQKLSRLEQLEAEYEKFQKQAPPAFANEEIAKFNSFVSKTGISDFGVFNKIKGFDPETASAVETLALQEIIENPELLKYGYDKVVQFVEKKYEDDLSDEDLGSIALDLKSSKAKKEITAMKSSLDESLYQAQPDVTQKIEQWKPVADAVVKNLSSIALETQKGNGFEFKIDDKHKQGLLEETLSVLASSNVEMNEEGIKSVQHFLENKIKLAYFDEIISSVRSNVESELRSEFQSKYENASDLTNKDSAQDVGQKESDQDKLFRMELENLN
jgi:hypothetical protein